MSVVSTATAIRIAPIPSEFLDRARRLGTDDQGQPVRRLIAEGGEPCRDVLRRANPGEELILASFTPFSQTGPYKEYGPVFILANDSGETIDRETLPMDGPLRYLRTSFVIRAYSADESILDAVMVKDDEAPEVVERFLANPETAFLHFRFPTYGCFALRIDRA